ncbi:DNA-binding transcriptional regulator BolA isoform X2 [Athalia rosae]|uniref:DNA-binding transcriptional regulator BolA isoform X2 n=1 Tax=Athalia rosae TaxID=37344 RepID=UPI0020344AA0|nr:DNA-binding transcriptional regulator BolA isoform X2 [Athalia rosae]
MYKLFSVKIKSRLPLVGRHIQNMTSLAHANPVEAAIRKKLTAALGPSFIEISNESHMHNVPKGSETHFKVIVVSDKFVDQPLIKRHRMVNDLLQNELQTGVHALSIVL